MGQKGVDIRIGLDIARIAVKHIVDIIVLVTGDSDFVPVMKSPAPKKSRSISKRSATACGAS